MCDGVCAHTPCRTHIFLTHFPCVAYGHRVHAWLKVFAVRIVISLDLTPLHSHASSASFAVAARSLRDHIPVCRVFAELFPIRKRGSSALPHERRGVWLLAGPTHSTERRAWKFLFVPRMLLAKPRGGAVSRNRGCDPRVASTDEFGRRTQTWCQSMAWDLLIFFLGTPWFRG